MKNMKWITGLALVIVTSQTVLANGVNLKSARGSVLIAAPTAMGEGENQGIWFENPKLNEFSLKLPMLPKNKAFEGWLVDEMTGKKISTGLFRSQGTIDSDAAGIYAGPAVLDFPPVPGSDFVTLGEDITDGHHAVVITLENYPKPDPKAVGMPILKISIPAGTMAGTQLVLENIVP